jgi:hypothetical protein
MMNPQPVVDETPSEAARRKRREAAEEELVSLLSQGAEDRMRHEHPKRFSPIQSEYKKMLGIMNMSQLAHDIGLGILELMTEADDCVSFSVTGGEDTCVAMSLIEVSIKKFRWQLKEATDRFKTRAGHMVCSPDNPFIYGQDRYPPPSPGHQLRLATQHWLAEHVGRHVHGGRYIAREDVTRDVTFPHEISPSDDSLIGVNGKVNYHVCPLLLRRLLGLVGMAIHWTRGLADRLEGALRSRARVVSDINDNQVLAMKTGEVLEILMHNEELHHAPDWFAEIFIRKDAVLCCRHPCWGLQNAVTTMLLPSYHLGECTSFPASGWAIPQPDADPENSEYNEYNEFACSDDQCPVDMSQERWMCQQMSYFLLECEELLQELYSSCRQDCHMWEKAAVPLTSRPMVESVLRTFPHKIELWTVATKIRICGVLEEVWQDCPLPGPEKLVLPNELYRGSPGNYEVGDPNGREHLIRVLGLIGSAFCQVCEGFIRIAREFQEARPRSLNYDNGISGVPVPFPNCFCPTEFLEEIQEEDGGAMMVAVTVSRFMMAASPRASNEPTVFDATFPEDVVAQQFAFSFPNDDTPRRLSPDYPDGQR